MKSAALLALLLFQAAATEAPVARPDALRYVRDLRVPPGTGQACASLDAQVFPHAAPSLIDLRLFPSEPNPAAPAPHELPYAITLSEAASEETEPARVLNLGSAGGDTRTAKIAFDLAMPDRPYTGVTLTLDPAVHDFLATATVTGLDSLAKPGERPPATALGSFTVFDLASQKLSRMTTLPLVESTFPYLHVVLSVSAAPGSDASAARFAPTLVKGAQVPPSREAQTVYTAVAETSSFTVRGRETVASFALPVRVPVERVSIQLPPGYKGNFSRDVRVTATTDPAPKDSAENDSRAPLPEVVTASILRVHTTEAGREIRTDQLSFPAILGANLQRAARVEVAIENGDDQPLPLASVRLEMRQRKICFEAPVVPSAVALYYGDPDLLAPVYDYQRLFVPVPTALAASLGPERLNPAYHPAPEKERPFTERHPELLWIALIAVISVLGAIAVRSSRNVGR